MEGRFRQTPPPSPEQTVNDRTKNRAGEDLNLLPVMNMVTILIPLLLLSAQFVNLAVIDSSLPAISDDPGPVDPERVPLELTVAITREGFTLRTRQGALDAQGQPAEQASPALGCLSGACGRAESYDYAALGRALSVVKDAHPDEEVVILAPDSRVPFEVLVGVMDAARSEPGSERLLFPQVVVAGGAG